MSKRKRLRGNTHRVNRKLIWSRWHVWATIIGIFVVIGITLSVLYIVPRWEKQTENKEEWNAILQLESSFLLWGEDLNSKIDRITDPFLRERLKDPFLSVQKNRGNPYRNANVSQDGTVGNDALESRLQNPEYFFYAIVARDMMPVSALYLSVINTVFVAPGSPPNVRDFLTLYHELHHVQQEADLWKRHIRSESDWMRYGKALENLYTQSGGAVGTFPEDEMWAYAYQLEMLDMQLNGELRSSIAKGNPLSVRLVMQKLRGRPDQFGPTSLLLKFAVAYFPEGLQKGKFTVRYVREVAAHLKNVDRFYLLVRDDPFHYREVSVEEAVGLLAAP